MQKELPVDRKYDLMIRDEQFNNYIEKSRQWLKDPNDEGLTEQVEHLRKQVWDKWNARIHWPETTIQGLTDFWMLVHEPYKAIEVGSRVSNKFYIDKDGKFAIASFQDNFLVYCPLHKIPIIIDPTILTLHDGPTVKGEVWKIVKKEIMKRKDFLEGRHIPADLVDFMPEDIKEKIKEKKTIKGRAFAVPDKEPAILAPIFRCRPETFAKYLRWYDLKMKGLSFRLIALIEFHSKPSYREQKIKEHIKKRPRPKIGLRVKGESTIREGFNIIYRAINRESAPTQEEDIPTSGEYNCPEHGLDCSRFEDCTYRHSWLADFDNKYKMSYEIGHLGSKPEDIDIKADKKSYENFMRYKFSNKEDIEG